MHESFWIGFEKQAGIFDKPFNKVKSLVTKPAAQEKFVVGKTGVNIAGPSAPIGHAHLNDVRKEMDAAREKIRKNPTPSPVQSLSDINRKQQRLEATESLNKKLPNAIKKPF